MAPTDQQEADLLRSAGRVLSAAGVRLMWIEDRIIVGVWSDLDSAELRHALVVYGSGDAPVWYLDGPGIPDKYKVRQVAGGENPVPGSVLRMMAKSTEPWHVRDRWIRQHHWQQRPTPYPFPYR